MESTKLYKDIGPRAAHTSGFTLIELMIVVGIISILASIATANYRKYAARARQSEAKVALASIYLWEQTFGIESNSYTQCLGAIGFGRKNEGRNYYMLGYMAGPSADCGPQGTGSCGATSWTPDVMCEWNCGVFDSNGSNDATFGANTRVNPAALLINTCAAQAAASTPTHWDAKRDQFIAGAIGNISDAIIYDQWQINEQKQLTNISAGL